MEFEFVVEMNLVQIGTNGFFPQLAANERHLQSRPYSNQKLGRRDQSAASSELFLSFTRRSFPTGTRDGGRREPCEPQPCSLGERNVCRDLAAVGIPRHVQESPVRGSNEGARGCTSRQRNTHNIESREVHYPWHPWHALTVAVHETFTRNGRAVCRCGVDENPGVRLLEIPQWMFDSVACCRMRLAAVPTVSCGALLDLKALLRCASFPDSAVVLQGQHRSLLSPGGADARITKPTESRSIQTISSAPEAPVLAGAASGNQTENSTVAGATAARAHRKSPRLRRQKGRKR